MRNIFTLPGRFWRGNLHTHSTRSDGVLDPAEVCRRYKAEGYDFIALTDHFVGCYGYPIVDTTSYHDAGFTTILGAELHSGAMENGELWHILAVGLPADFAPRPCARFSNRWTGRKPGQRLPPARAMPGPSWPLPTRNGRGMTLADARSIQAAHAVEVYNHGCAMGAARPDGFAIADLLLAEGRALSLWRDR